MSNSYVVAYSYARALFGEGRDKAQLVKYYDALNVLTVALADNNFKMLILNKSIGRKKVIEVVKELISSYSDSVLENFCLLLVQNNILGLIAEITKEYKSLLENYNNEVCVVAEYAAQPNNELQKRHEQFLSAKFNKNIKTEVVINPDILAGVRFTIGDLVIDASLQSRIDQLETSLIV